MSEPACARIWCARSASRLMGSMHTLIARHLICPLHERLLGRPTFAYLRELERSQWFAPADIRALQRTKLAALLRHARDTTVFYGRRLGGIPLDDVSGVAVEVLRALPLTTKADIRESMEEMTWRDAPGGAVERHTGGSTGEPLRFRIGRRRQAYDQAARYRCHRWFDVQVGERELFLWGSPIEWSHTDRVKRIRDWLFHHRLISAFGMAPAGMDGYLDTWDRFRPVSLYGYPSSIALLAEHARSRNRILNTRALKAVFVTGEVCFPHQRQAITEYFGVPVADGYGSREAGFIAHQCPAGGMHVCAENVIVEIVDETGHPVATGQAGEIVVTHLDAYAMPFIRYRTGDVGRLVEGRCRCGRGLPLMDVVAGRSTDHLILPDGTVRHALSIIYPIRAVRGVRQFRVIQHEDHGVTVEVVADDGAERITHQAVATRVRPVIGPDVALRIELVDRIPPSESGKHRYVVSHAHRPMTACIPERPARV